MRISADDKSRMRLVGRLVRSYREDSTHGGGTLSPDVLRYLMSAHRDIGKDGHPVGVRHGRPEPMGEMAKVLFPGSSSRTSARHLRFRSRRLIICSRWLIVRAQSEEEASASNPLFSVLKSLMSKIVPPGGYTSLGGYSFGALGLNGTESLLAYVGGLLALIAGLGVWRWRKLGQSDEVIDDLFFASLLFLLNTPLLLGAVTRVDPYGLFTLPAFEVGAFLFMLVILMNLMLSLAAWYFFIYLKKWLLSEENRSRTRPFMRSAGVTLPPIISLYAFILVFSNPGGWIYYLAILGALFGAFTVILAFNNPDSRWSEREVKWGPPVALQAIVILCVLGVAGMLVIYLEPSLVVDTARHNLLWSWESGFASLGFSEDELIERFRVGVVWMSLAAIAYLATIIGSYLVVKVRRSTAGVTINQS